MKILAVIAMTGLLSVAGDFVFAPASSGQTLKMRAGVKKGVLPTRHGLKLDATVAQNQEFPPLPDSLMPGASFQDDEVVKELTDSQGADRWYQIPAWLAGEYSYGDMVTYENDDLQNNAVKHVNVEQKGLSHGRHRGMLTDKSGGIWQMSSNSWISASAATASERDNFDYKRFENDIIGYIVSPTKYVESSDGVEFYIDKKTGKIDHIDRFERIRTFEHEKGGAVSVDASEETYGADGHPIERVKARGHFNKQAEYQAIEEGEVTKKGTYDQLAKSLKTFLEQIGKGDQAPSFNQTAEIDSLYSAASGSAK